ARRILRAYPDISVQMRFTGTAEARDERLESPEFDRLLNRVAMNPLPDESVAPRPDHRSMLKEQTLVGAEYLIITAPAFVSQANDLRDWKITKGISTLVKTTADTGSTSAQIKSYIRNAYNTWSPAPTYVLLLGDVETIPTTYQTTSERGTDLYYSAVDGSDYVPDILLGRISVDTAQQADIVVQKIIGYENDPPTLQSFYQKAAVVGYFEDATMDGYADRRFAQTCEDVRDYLISQDYTVQRIYCTKTNITPRYWNKGTYASGQAIPSALLRANGFAWDGDAADISSAINAGVFLVMHRDHGGDRNSGWSATGWDKPRFTHSHVATLANGELLPVVLSINCQSGWFDGETDHVGSRNYESFCELLLRKENGGAIGVFGSTRNSISGYNDYMVMGFLDSVWPGFLTGAANPSGSDKRLGAMLNHGKFAMDQIWGDRWGSRKMEYELFHLHGDPSLEMRTESPSSGQSFAIYNDGNADLLITNMTKRDGQSWLSFSPGAPLTIRPGQSQIVDMDVDWGAALRGATNDRIMIYNNDADMNPYPSGVDVGIPGRPPVLRVSPLSLDPSVTQGGSPSSLSFNVWNDGIGTMSYTVASNASWLTVVPSTGSSTGEADTLQVQFQTAGLPAGTYEGQLTVTAAGADKSPASVVVHLTVNTPQPAIQRDPTLLTRTIRLGETASNDSFEVWNSGGDAMFYTIASNVSWLSVEPTSGINVGDHDTILVRFHTAGLAAGSHEGLLSIASGGATNSPQTISVQITVVVSDDVYEHNDTPGTAYDWTYEGANSPQDFHRTWLSEEEGLAVQADEDWYKIRVEPGYEHVTVTCLFAQAQGDIDLALCDAAGTELAASRGSADNESLTVTVGASGYYFIRVFGANAGNEYDLWWNGFDAEPVLTGNVSSLSRSIVEGQTADGQAYEVWNEGGGDLAYQIVENCAWLSVAPTNGSSAGEHDEIQVSYVTAALASGSYAAVITNRALAGRSNEVLVAVSLFVSQLDDQYETNNSPGAAYDLAPHRSNWLHAVDGYGVQRDEDWYRISVPA
ncbi:MAG: pre-peptidase C-terminal domain-containing protein, partial [Verrucomicrobia bacterium]|nr:pre-peptidase C-terminal domain-containing protein [Verrucomicrobiota bacterium]